MTASSDYIAKTIIVRLVGLLWKKRKEMYQMTKKKGYWKEHLLLYGCWKCSNCNKHIYNNFGVTNLENYCPKCGSRMQGKGNK